MLSSKIEKVLSKELDELGERGSLKGKETVVTGVREAKGGKGPLLEIEEDIWEDTEEWEG